MRNPHGYALITDPDAPLWERDTATCCHCGSVIFVKPGTVNTVYLINTPDGRWIEEPGASCYNCMKPVCLPCCDLGICRPLQQLLDELEGRKPRPLIVRGS